MSGHYNFQVVALSLVIAVIVSYAALDLASRVTTATTRAGRATWLGGGSIVMGFGIWTMHFIGMAAFILPVGVMYDWPTVCLSLVAAIASSWFGLFLAARNFMTGFRATLASLGMGFGISTMHYIAMEAMRLPAKLVYSPLVVASAVAIAIGMSFGAYRLAFLRSRPQLWGWPKAGSAVLMGLAIASMHYVAMASATFVPAPMAADRLGHAVSASGLGLATIVVSALVLLTTALVASTIDRKTAMQSLELLRSRQHFASVFEAMAEGIVIQDIDGNVVQINRAASRLLGLPKSPVDHEKFIATFELMKMEGTTLPFTDWPAACALRGEACQDTELIIQNKHTGVRFFAEWSSALLPNSDCNAHQIMSTIRDVTERKHMDIERTLVAAIVASSEDAIVGKDLKGYVTSWNPGAEKIYGYTAAEMLGNSIRLIVPADRQAEEDSFLAQIANGESVEHVETIRQRKDGLLINVSVTISPIRDTWGQIVGASKIARDITDRMKVERQLAQNQKMDAIGQLTGGISHDFNNLLGVIIGNLDLLERLILGNETAIKRLHTARKAAERGADLTRRLLAFSRAEELRPAVLDLKHVIRNVLELAGPAIGSTIKTATDFDREANSVFVDRSSFETALLNLVINARDAMPQGGTLTISTAIVIVEKSYLPVQAGDLLAGCYTTISVSDSGTGMPQAVMDRAFEPFYTTKPRSGGTGLGLAMVYGFAKQSGGTVRIYSEVGVGTSVTIYLPVITSETVVETVAVSLMPLHRTGGTVLVVDDETDLLEIAVVFLQDLGYETLEASDGKSALKVLMERHDIVLMVTDITMPGGINGVQLGQMARQLIPSICIVYTSGFPAGALQEKNMSFLTDPLLRKPYRRLDFDLAVQEVTNRKTSDKFLS